MDLGRAPDGIAFSSNGNYIYVLDFLDRKLRVIDCREFITGTGSLLHTIRTIDCTLGERLSHSVLGNVFL